MRVLISNERSKQGRRRPGRLIPINASFAEPARWKRCVPRLRSLTHMGLILTRGSHGMGSNSTVKRRSKKTPSASRGGNGRGAKTARTTIAVQGARVHNLRNISLEIPRDSLIVVTGLSGSGKSSLAFDTIYAEGQRRYIDRKSTRLNSSHLGIS